MSVFKRQTASGSRWVVQVYNRQTGRMEQDGTYKTAREAKAAEAKAIVAAGRASAKRETVGSFAERWLEVFPRPRESTNRHNGERVKPFTAQHKNRAIDKITAEEARVWALAHRSQLPALRAMFNDARRLGLTNVNPFERLGMKQPRGRRDLAGGWLTADQVDDLAEIALATHGDYGPAMRAMILFAAYTGVRPGELYALQHDDLGATSLWVRRSACSKTRTISHTKNELEREIIYPQVARDAVASMPMMAGQQTVFAAPRGGRLWQSHFNWLWNPVRASFGRPKMAFYELRHFCATNLLELGLSASDVAVQLGHRDNGKLVMNTYGHPSEKAARERILAALDGRAA